jgi:hypothetical protein
MSPLPTGTRFPIQVVSTIKPVNGAPIPVVSDVDIEGGYQVRTDLTDRDSIPADNRKEGMLVFVQSDGYFYTLAGGITNSDWVVKDFGGGGGGTLAGDVTGPAGTNTVVAINNVPIDTGTPPTIGGALHYVQPTDTTLFPQPQAMATDGVYVWTGNYRSKIINRTHLATRTTINIDLTSFLPGPATSFVRNIKTNSIYPNFIFCSTMDAGTVLILDKTTNAVLGIGDAGGDRIRCCEVDSNGNVWGGGHSGSQKIYRFNVVNMLSNYPSPVIPSSSVSVADDAEEMAYDGTYLWVTSTNGDVDKVITTGSGINAGNHNNGGWNADVVCALGFTWVLDQQNQTIEKYQASLFPSAPLDTVTLTGINYLNAFCFSNGYFWVPDNASSTGPTNDSVVKVQAVPLLQISNIDPPGTEREWFEAIPDPSLNKIYVAVYSDSVSSNNQGFRVLDTGGSDAWLDSFSKTGPPQLRYIPASCTSAIRPANPFVGQMVFVTDLDTPNPIALWWNGNNWVDDQGFTR